MSEAAGNGEQVAWERTAFARVVGRVSTAFGYASAILMLAAMLVISYAAFLRYLVGASTVWQTELSVYFLMFATFCGASYALRHGDHVSIDLVVLRLPPVGRRVVRLAAAVLGLVLVVVIAVMSYDSWWETVEEGRRSGTAWNPSLVIPHLIVPVGMTLLAVQYLALIAELAGRLRHPDPEGSRGEEDASSRTAPQGNVT